MKNHGKIENEFLHDLINGNEKGILKIYSTFYPSIEKYILKNSGTSEEAKDVFQDGLMVFYEKRKEADFQLNVKFGTYLFAICRNIWLKQLRSKKNTNVVTFESDLVLIDEDVKDLEIENFNKYKLYKSKFDQLGEECKKMLTFFFQKKSMAEITTLMKYKNDSYTRKKKYKCKEKLIQLIRKDPEFKQYKP